MMELGCEKLKLKSAMTEKAVFKVPENAEKKMRL